MGSVGKVTPVLSARSLNAFPYHPLLPTHTHTGVLIDVHENPSAVPLKVTTGLLLQRFMCGALAAVQAAEQRRRIPDVCSGLRVQSHLRQ